MLKIYNLKEKMEYVREISVLTQHEWGTYSSEEEFEFKVNKKIEKIKANLDKINYCKLILLDDEKLVGFISLFPTDGEEKKELTPWYATMFIKKEYRGKGYSKILNQAILSEAKSRGFKKVYLKSDLKNYYEKFGAIYLEDLKNGEKLYYINL